MAPANTRTTVVSSFRYRDTKAAIASLCDVFGFTRHGVYEDDNGAVMHAELAFGNGMIMLGQVRHDAANAYGDNIVQPDEVNGKETQSLYLIVADADAVYARAKRAGFPMVREIQDESYGGRGFTCRDLEGRMWSVGTYDPWSHPATG